MTIELKDVIVKFDLDNAADQQFNIDVSGESLNDIVSQINAFADEAKFALGARRVEKAVGRASITDLGRLFKGAENPNANEE